MVFNVFSKIKYTQYLPVTVHLHILYFTILAIYQQKNNYYNYNMGELRLLYGHLMFFFPARQR